MSRLLDALDRLDSLRQRPGTAQSREQDVAPPPRRSRNASDSRAPRPRVPRAPTHLDLTDDSADTSELESASEFRAIDLEPAAPHAPRNRARSTSGDRPVETPQPPPPSAKSGATVRSATGVTEPAQQLDPRLPTAQDDALRLALQIRAALHKAHTNTVMICGVEPGQTVRRLTRELALAFVQLREAPILVVDLEPGETSEARYEFHPLEETDPSSWINPGHLGRPSAAVLSSRPQQGRHRGFVNMNQFSKSLENWRTQAAFVMCCARSIPDSTASLAAGTCCGVTLLVVPGTGSTNDSVLAARELCTRSGITLIGCVIDETPADSTTANQ